ncbi:hypothetical protein ACHAXR_001722, partial [Thalassiosira sp. AJA248-18]
MTEVHDRISSTLSCGLAIALDDDDYTAIIEIVIGFDVVIIASYLQFNKAGVTVVKDTLSPFQLIEWKAKTQDVFENQQNNNIVWNSGRAHCSISKGSSVHYSDMSRIGCSSGACDNVDDATTTNLHENADSSWLNTFFRQRRRNKSSNIISNAESATSSQPVASLQDVVKSYFQQHGIKRYNLTDVQFLNAYPKSTNQIWHRDNQFRGLTAIVALKDVSDNGPTELIVGSHRPDYRFWSQFVEVIMQNYYLPMMCYFKGGQGCGGLSNAADDDSVLPTSQPPPLLLLVCIDEGDAVLYDARIIHRGRGNNTMMIGDETTTKVLAGEGGGSNNTDDHDRPVLVLRWDAAHTPPPGAGLIISGQVRHWRFPPCLWRSVGLG